MESFFWKQALKENNKISENKWQGFNLKTIFGLLLLIAAVYLWRAGLIIKSGIFLNSALNIDTVFYAEISKCLFTTCAENIFTSSKLINHNYNFPTPYHYYDLWFNGFICKIFNLNHTLSLFLITYSFFTANFLFGLLAVIEKYKAINFWDKLIALLLLFVAGLNISKLIPSLSQYNNQMEGMMERLGEKLIPAYCLALFIIFIFVFTKNSKPALILLLCLPCITISITPAVFTGLLLFCLYKIFSKTTNKLFYLRLLCYCLITAACIMCFYLLLMKNEMDFRLDKPLMSYTDLNSFSFFRFKFYFVELFLKCYMQPFIFILNYLPFILILFYLLLFKKSDSNFKSLLILFGLIWLGAVLTSNTFYLLYDGFQFYTNALALFHILFCLAFIIFYYTDKSKIRNLLSFLFIAVLFFNFINVTYSSKQLNFSHPKFSEKYLREVNKASEKIESNTKGAIFCDDEFYKNSNNGYPLEYYSTPFIMSQSLYIPFNLTDCNQIPERVRINNIRKNLFNVYINEQKKISPGKTLLQYQMDFIRENNIRYLICPKGQNIDFLNSLSVNAQIKDSLSGQTFITLN